MFGHSFGWSVNSLPVQRDNLTVAEIQLRVCLREDRAGVTHAILTISFKLSHFMRINELIKKTK